MGKTAGVLVHKLLLYMLLFSATSLYADDGDILDRKVEITLVKATKYNYLRYVSDKTGYYFVYDSKVINNDQEITIQPGLYTMREFIVLVAESRSVAIKVIGNHIALSINQQNPRVTTLNQPQTPLPKYHIITGRVSDMFSKEFIPSTTLTINNTSIGTVSNQDGLFRLVVPDSLKNHTIRISHVGYENREFGLHETVANHIDLLLEPKVVPLQEVVIRVVNPIHTVQRMLDQRQLNYSSTPAGFTVYYREGIEHKKQNVDLTESVLKVYKNGFEYTSVRDQVKLIKMRRITDKQEKDTIVTKVKAGIHSALLLDVVKNIPDYLESPETNEFVYTYADISVIDNRLVYVISFEQKPYVTDPLFTGQLYIDTENFALIEANIEINPEYIEKATSLFVEKSSRNFRLTLKRASYRISYRQSDNGLYYLNHVRGDLEFRVKRKKKWFSTNLRVWFEMVNCKVEVDNVHPIPRTERLSLRSILSETPYIYDPDFWGGMNVIVPEEELRDFILRNLQEPAKQ